MSENGTSERLVPEEFCGPASLVSDNETFLSASLDFEDLHNGTITGLDIPQNVLVYFKGIFGRFLEENGVRNCPDVGFSVKCSGEESEK